MHHSVQRARNEGERGREERERDKRERQKERERDTERERERERESNYGKLAANRTTSKLWQDTTERMRLNPEKCRVIKFFKTKKMSNELAFLTLFKALYLLFFLN